jgi:outer membrane receptor protein involved in Fe transport
MIYPTSTGANAIAMEPSRLNNPDLTWETSQQTDIGLDIRAFNDRLSLTVDYYNKTTKGLIFTGTPPYASGNQAPRYNGGDVENKGFEFDLGYKNVIGDLKYSVNVNFSTLKNNVTSLNPILGKKQGGASIGTGWSNATMFEPGYPMYHFHGYKTNGIDPSTGIPFFVTAAGKTVVIDSIKSTDQQDIGNPIPKIIYGGAINLAYKGADLTVTFNGTQGNKVLMGWFRSDKPAENRPREFFDNRWTPTNKNASRPKADWSASNGQTYNSDQLVFDGSFMRIQTIQLGYTLPSSLLKVTKINTLRVYVSFDNFFTFTKYPGMDPQPTIANNTPNNIGIDRGTYPMAKDVMIGASISF